MDLKISIMAFKRCKKCLNWVKWWEITIEFSCMMHNSCEYMFVWRERVTIELKRVRARVTIVLAMAAAAKSENEKEGEFQEWII